MMLTARSFAAKNRYEIDVDREFAALGAGFALIFPARRRRNLNTMTKQISERRIHLDGGWA
jgi:hypothetical protein